MTGRGLEGSMLISLPMTFHAPLVMFNCQPNSPTLRLTSSYLNLSGGYNASDHFHIRSLSRFSPSLERFRVRFRVVVVLKTGFDVSFRRLDYLF
ncbi:hypothetical protein M408DRAFT_139139 [Serendipita vermifera MAFF 305830]|uniref:Uncharacterized protein n=1 Tax=Serendipita vermifera MAFF 305830 TaxID=933852 RepID=A0A0C2WRX7_SERVB|nr:hypothetical protein M408DRAFT_139139 [Serendipita vermifera MAFF 305830]